jgi:hypothetical protein
MPIVLTIATLLLARVGMSLTESHVMFVFVMIFLMNEVGPILLVVYGTSY